MFSDLLIGSIIILAPLGVLILIIARDLKSKERQLSRRIRTLNDISCSLAKKDVEDPKSVLDGLELDGQDKEQVDMLAIEIDNRCEEEHDAADAPMDNYALAAEKVAAMRLKERLMLRDKIRYFKIYATFMYILIWVSLGILPLLYYMGFNWHWK